MYIEKSKYSLAFDKFRWFFKDEVKPNSNKRELLPFLFSDKLYTIGEVRKCLF